MTLDDLLSDLCDAKSVYCKPKLQEEILRLFSDLEKEDQLSYSYPSLVSQ